MVLQDGLLLVFLAYKAAGIDVDRGQRLSLIEDQVAARFEPHFAVQGALDLRFDPEMVEDWLLPSYSDTRERSRGMYAARTATSRS